jgi:hypothetical protein
MTIIARLDSELPKQVRLHLFGVKGTAIERLAGHQRIFSVDSMAWDYAARAHKNSVGVSSSMAMRQAFMSGWYADQRRNLGLFA